MGICDCLRRLFGGGAGAAAPDAPEFPAVSELGAEINDLLSRSLGERTVYGEITSIKKKPGIWYLTLSDDSGMISCVVPRRVFAALEPPKSRFPDAGFPGNSRAHPEPVPEADAGAGDDGATSPESSPETDSGAITSGIMVRATGRVSFYTPAGSLQLEITDLKPEGPGERHLRFQALREKLREKGYFDPASKRPLPEQLKTIGVATARDGAVIHDIEVTVRNSGIPFALRLYPTRVQGRGAAASIARSLEYISREGVCDAVILARGGGSSESLAVFSSEEVTEAVFSSGIPVIAAIGHEINRSLADEAADFSVATPTAAAELLIRTVRERRLRAEARARRMLVFRILLVIAGVLAMAALFWFLRSR
ncbi:exodeoxyribonuclease VII large subunit [Succinimonas amylolytica]|uniref:exodeoxyribonuclease VII large subunit n=1 Tax=Succinimonas amylolytica TaxID=83769 RepID=UPI0003607BDC|nr:exodeoxyribonuclease VII large subunit [Succinimonas amylolytica]